MLHFFRKIRRKLFEQGKVKSYLLYAIGEIMLIMIGILLALQVTNWNDQQKNKKIERTYLEAMKVELEENKNTIERVMKKNIKGIENAEKLAELLEQNFADISSKEVSKLFNEVFKHKIQYTPNSGVRHDILNSGNLNKISNFQLRNILAGWEAHFSQVKAQEESITDIRENIIDLLKRTGHFEGIKQPSTGQTVGLRLKTSGNQINIDYTEFKNNLLFLIVTSAALSKNYYGSFDRKIEQTLDLINEELGVN